MPTLRPVDHLQAASRDYPAAWKQYASFVARRGQLGDWPAWCYCPMAAAYAIVSGGANNRVELDRSLEISRLAALAAWRPTQGVYRFDQTLLDELLTTPVSGDIPAEHLQRLPEWCVYVELSDPRLHGFFAHLEWDANEETAELRLLLDDERGLIPIAIHLGSTIDAGLAAFLAHANAQIAQAGAPLPAFGAGLAREISGCAEPLVSVLLYLCAESAEMRPVRDTARRHELPGLKRGRHGQPYQPAARPEVWETGFALGRAIREAEEAARRGVRVGPMPHVRRAHWRSQPHGPRNEQRKLIWIHPVLVGVGELTPTVRRVRE